ncbi:MAG: hypothetical protein ACRDQX_06175 [Pseudonocardiaceae bacterium]
MLALLDLDGTLVDRKAGFLVWAQALVEEHALGAEALAWLTATDLAVTERDRFFALVGERFPVVGGPAALWDDYRACMQAAPRRGPRSPRRLVRLGRDRDPQAGSRSLPAGLGAVRGASSRSVLGGGRRP